ncbi:DUF2214 family protein [Pseudomonas kielensis]|uniref:DUF2214 family protein n=1 Tax=Pseudomonas kielensis TaxID=2762577 RepID=A0A7X1KXF2_9PSED|nr:DUF2214 family protein [Pseudomonas kielensis]MBC2690217.1 DUF2214 family protein [Pseudomonas kielensis]
MAAHWLLAAVHLLAYALALWAVLARASAFRRVTADGGGARSVLLADNVWGVSAIILLLTGVMRAFGGYEKGTDYYLHQPLFHLKMGVFILILLLEIAPMRALIKWRIALGRQAPIDVGSTALFARICHVEALLIVLMVVAATGMARAVAFG